MDTQVVIIGAGGAGMMCALHAGRRYREVLILDHASKIGGKILISGGGRCNFTNLGASPANYVSQNPHFMKSALSRYPSSEFIAMVKEHEIPFHEKKLGQLFCDGSAQAIVDLLKKECQQANVQTKLGRRIDRVSKLPESEAPFRFALETSSASSPGNVPETVRCESLVIATGGLSIPKLGATGFGYEVATQFGLKLVERAAALDGFTFAGTDVADMRELAGLSIDVTIEAGGVKFRENILFTHSGLSGPAALQASLHWYPGEAVTIDLLPELSKSGGLFEWMRARKKQGDRKTVKNLLGELLPNRFVDLFCRLHFSGPSSELPLPQVSEKLLADFCARLHQWTFIPSGTVGYSKAEVTRGGVDTDELSSKTLEAKKVPGLYFIGEVVDVTGWLGGYNFQWAWASGWAAGQVV